MRLVNLNDVYNGLNAIKDTLVEDSRRDERFQDDIRDLLRNIGDNTRQSMNNSTQDFNPSEFGEQIGGSISGVLSRLFATFQVSRFLSYLDDITGSLLYTSNELQKIGVGNSEMVREYRQFVNETQKSLNEDTGGKYNLKTMYQDIASLIQSTDISRMDTLKEITRPAMLAYRSMNVSLESIADLSGKLYEYAGIDSMKLEGMLNHVKTISEGMNVSEQTLIDNMNMLTSSITAIGSKRGFSEDVIQEAIQGVSDFSTILEGAGISSTDYVSLMQSAIEGNTESRNQLRKYGIDPDTLIQDLANDPSKLAYDLATYGANLYGSFGNGVERSSAEQGFGLSNDLLMQDFIAVETGLLERAVQDYERNLKNPDTMTDSVEDQYQDLSDRIANELSEHTSLLTDIRDKIGVGFMDIAQIGLTIASILQISKLFGGSGSGSLLSGSLAGSGGASAVGTTLSGTLSAIAPMAGVAGASLLSATPGLYLGYNDIKEGEYGFGAANIAGGLAMGAGAGVLSASLLGFGAANAWNPAGWVSLIAGAATLVGTALVDAATTFGEADAVAGEYKKAKEQMLFDAKDQRDLLLDVKSGLENNEDLETTRSKLIESGILSESDLEKARDANKEGLEELTKAYMTAVDGFSKDYSLALDEYEKNDVKYAKELKDELEKTFQKWNDSLGGPNKDQKEAMDTVFYSLYKDLESQVSNGVELDKKTKKTYENLKDAYEDGKLTEREINRIMDEGFFNTTFQNSNFSVEALVDSVDKMSAIDDDMNKIAEKIKPDSTYYGSEEASYVLSLASKALNAPNEESAKEYLDQLKEAGYSSEKYKEIGEAAEKWGLSSYDKGTDYVDSDQLALIHEGEAIIPKKNNPAANIAELEALRAQVRSDRNTSNNYNERLNSNIESLLSAVRSLLSAFNLYVQNTENRRKEETINTIIAKNEEKTSKTLFESLFGGLVD